MSKQSYPIFDSLCVAHGFSKPVREHKFHPVRKWRLDFSWPDALVAVEVEGGLFLVGGGRHNRGASMKNDMEKYNEAALAGWIILRYTPDQLTKSQVFNDLAKAFALSGITHEKTV